MKRKMTRRNFLKVAAAVSAAGVMSACGGDGMPPASSGNGNTGNTGNAGDTGNSGENPDNGSGGDSGEEEEVIETKWYYSRKADGTVSIGGYGGTLMGDVTIPDKIGNYPVSEVGGFAQCNGIESLTIPASVTRINTYGFEFCKSLKHVYFSEGLQIINNCAFQGCSALEEIKLPDSLKTMGLGAFRDCKNVMALTISSQLKVIPIDGFRDLGIEEVVIPKSVEKIEDSGLRENRNLKNVRFLGEPQIDSYVFCGCGSLESIEFPDNLERIGKGMFLGCSALSEVKLPSKLKVIEEMAFEGANLTAIDFPEGLVEIGDDAFGYLNVWKTTFPNSLKK